MKHPRRNSSLRAHAWRQDPSPQRLEFGDGVVRFRDPAFAGVPAPAFPGWHVRQGWKHPTHSAGISPAAFPVRPRFCVRRGKKVARIDIEPGTNLYGTGEVPGPLERRGTRTVCWNTDCFGYDGKTPSLYQSHPWVLAVRRDGTSFGIVCETTHRCVMDLRRGIQFECDGPAPYFTVMVGRDPGQVVSRLYGMTGYIPLPPKWALGYHQSRWSYESETKVRELADQFRARGMPCDAIWLDIDYMDGFRCFTFDKQRFPEVGKLNDDLHARGFKTVWMIDPGIKVDPEYGAYREGRDGGHFVKNAAGAEHRGSVWPGECAFPDFTNESTRRWWAGLYEGFLATGVDGVWNDMNEPAIFDGPGKSMPESCVHRADEELGGSGNHARYHNIYGMQMVRATRQGMHAARRNRRAFVLTRSNFLGGQRYAATWTGDNTSNWEHLRYSISMALNLSLSGQPFVGPDIGGFSGNADGRLFSRWMGIAAMLPFARGHSIKESVPHEPWAFGEECERVCRLALERRYRLLPYLYTLFKHASGAGIPVVTPLFFCDSRSAALRRVDDCFLLGPDLLVRASVTPDGTPSRSDMPQGSWARFEPACQSHPDLPELFIRRGAIIPMGPALQYVGERPLDPLTLLVCPSQDGSASGTLLDDDGEHWPPKCEVAESFECERVDGKFVVSHTGLCPKSPGGASHTPDCRIEVILLSEAGAQSGSGRWGEKIVVG